MRLRPGRRSGIFGGGLAVLALILLVVVTGPMAAGSGRAADVGGDAGGTATPTGEGTPAEVEELRSQVAALSTEVARLAGDEDETLAGRLGGERGGFTVAYGPPLAYLGPDDVVYEVAEVGRLTAGFVDERARRLVVVPDRPEEKPSDEADPADWSLAEAEEVALRFAPADAAFGEEGLATALAATGDEAEPATGSSEALAVVAAPLEAGACPTAGGQTFGVAFTRPTEETVSAITLELAAGDGGAVAAGELVEAEDGRTRGGASAVANSSLGGVVTVNGIRVEAFNTRADAEVEGVDAPAEGNLFAVEIAVENGTERALGYQPSDFVLVDPDGRELSAACGGVEPAIAIGELAPGEALEGWVTFVLPEEFEPERFVFLAADARVGFEL